MQTGEHSPASDHLTFTRWLAGILLRWRLIAAVTIATLVIGFAATFIIPPVWRSSASFVANTSGSSRLQGALGSGSGAIGGLISQLGGSVGGDPSESPNFYIQLLTSRELRTRVVESRFPNPRTVAPNDSATLVEIYKIKQKDPQRRVEIAIKKLSDATHAGFDPKTNLVLFTVDAQWPQLSAQIANLIIARVSAFNRETRVSRAKSKRLFLEERLDSARTELNQAEDRQRVFYDQNRQWRTSAMLTVEEARLRREMDAATELYQTLRGQLEVARIDEFNDAALITVIDSAVAPRKAQWPRYGVLGITALVLGLVAGTLIAGSAAVLADWRERNPDAWNDFRSAVRTTRHELGSLIGMGGKRRRETSAPVATYPPSHAAPQQPALVEEPAARVQRPVA